MKEIFLLTNILLKGSKSDTKRLGETKINSFSRVLFFLLIYGYVIGFMSYISYYMIDSLVKFGTPEIFFNIVFSIVLGFGLIQTIINGLNILYFSKDLEFLLPLPIKSKKIVFAKLNCLIISQYMIESFFILPGIVIYGIILKLNIIYYIVSLLSLIIFPVIPVSLMSLLISIIMKFTKIIKNKDVVQYFTIILTLFLILSIQSLTGYSNNPSQEELVLNLIQSNDIIEEYFSIFINVDLTIKAILNYNNFDGVIKLMILTITSFLMYYISSNLISKMYVNTVVSLKTIKKKTINTFNVLRKFDDDKIVKAYVKKEFKILNRNPIFFMQCVLPIIIFPIVIGIPAILGLKDSGVDFNVLQKDLELIVNSNYGIIAFLITIIFMYIFNYTSVTAVSRDGENAVFMKYMPIDLSKQIFYKAIPGILLNLIPTIYILIFILLILPSVSLKTSLSVFTITILINILNNLLSIIIDLKNPKLKWISEYAVVKQNFNMIFTFLFVAIEIGFIMFCGIYIKNTEIYIGFLIFVFAMVNIITKKYISQNETKIFGKII